MRIKMIVYSYSLNTLHLVQMWAKQLNQHTTSIDSIHAYDEDPNTKHIQLSESPSVNGADHLVFATCVRGFDLAPIMQAYLKQIPNLDGRLCTLVLTQFFPFTAWGGKQAMRTFVRLVEAKGGQVQNTFILNRTRNSAAQRARIVNHVPHA